MVTWGDSGAGGDNTSPTGGTLTSGVTQISSTQEAFAALKSDGSVVTWGDSGAGGDNTSPTGGTLTSGVETVASPLFRPAYLPGAPTGVTAAQPATGETSAVISFTPPAANGGTPVTSYSATCTSSTGGATATATTDVAGATTITVSGLTLGATYTCTVSALNLVGTGPASAPSASFATTTPQSPQGPEAPATPTSVGALQGRAMCMSGGICITSGTVPDGATGVVQVATGGSSQMAQMAFGARATARVATGCTITTTSTRTYTCRIRLGAGRWTLTTQAKAGSTVIAQSVKHVTVKRVKRTAVTG